MVTLSCVAVPGSTQATVINTKREVVGVIPGPPRTDREVLVWIHEHADGLREELAAMQLTVDVANLELLVEYTYVQFDELPPTRGPWAPYDSGGRRAAFIVRVPYVRRGTPWVAENGQVVTGYRRTVIRENAKRDAQEAIVVDDKRHQSTNRTVTETTQMVPLDPNEPVRSTDEPITAPTIILEVDAVGQLSVEIIATE